MKAGEPIFRSIEIYNGLHWVPFSTNTSWFTSKNKKGQWLGSSLEPPQLLLRSIDISLCAQELALLPTPRSS
jgi:hypothetical protein